MIVPRDTYCVIDHLRRDVAVADAAVTGRFTSAGVALDLGPAPDWRNDGLPGDKEWRIEWVKFYFGLDLAHAFSVSGDPRYLAAWCRAIDGWIAQVPTGFDSSDVSARRLQNWVYAWQRFAASPGYPGLPDGLDERLLAHLAADLDHLAANLTPERNHRTLELYTLFIVPLALPDLDPRGDRRDAALAGLAENLATDVWADGVHRECSSDYHCIVLRSFAGVMENARRHGIPLPAGWRERFGQACDFAMWLHRPDGLIASLSDGDTGDFRPLLGLCADHLGREDLRWVATSGARGVAPPELRATFPVGGYSFQRSGWGDGAVPYPDELWAVMDHGPLGDGGHGHYDALSVELYAHGAPVAVDPGRYTYAEDPEGWRRYFKGTAGHNTVAVDDLDQTAYRRSRPKKGQPVHVGRLEERVAADGLDVVTGAVDSPVYTARHVRSLALVRGRFWVVADHLRDETDRVYRLHWHLTPRDRDVVRRTPTADGAVVETAGAVLVVAGGEVEVRPGWVSPEYGVKHEAPVVVATRAGRDADLATVVVPRRPGEPVPAVRFLRCDGLVDVEVTLDGQTHRVTLGPGVERLTTEPA